MVEDGGSGGGGNTLTGDGNIPILAGDDSGIIAEGGPNGDSEEEGEGGEGGGNDVCGANDPIVPPTPVPSEFERGKFGFEM